jgi:hypothetical protein
MATKLADVLALRPDGWTAGETLPAVVCFDSAYSCAAYGLRYDFTGGVDHFSVACADTGTGFRLTVGAATTLPVTPGDYAYVAYATADTDGAVTAVDRGTVYLAPNPARVSHASRCLTAIRARIEGRASADQLTIQMGDVQLQHMSMDQLIKAAGYFAGQVRAELAASLTAAGSTGRGRILTEFSR